MADGGDLVFGPEGNVYGTATETGGYGNDVLVTIDIGSGAATRVNGNSDLGFGEVFGLFFYGAKLYGLTADEAGCVGGALIVIDRTAGVGSFVRCLVALAVLALRAVARCGTERFLDPGDQPLAVHAVLQRPAAQRLSIAQPRTIVSGSPRSVS